MVSPKDPNLTRIFDRGHIRRYQRRITATSLRAKIKEIGFSQRGAVFLEPTLNFGLKLLELKPT